MRREGKSDRDASVGLELDGRSASTGLQQRERKGDPSQCSRPIHASFLGAWFSTRAYQVSVNPGLSMVRSQYAQSVCVLAGYLVSRPSATLRPITSLAHPLSESDERPREEARITGERGRESLAHVVLSQSMLSLAHVDLSRSVLSLAHVDLSRSVLSMA